MDLLVDVAGRMTDFHHATARFWGTGRELFEATSIEDTARMTARAAVDQTLGSGQFASACDIISMEAVVDAVEPTTGGRFERRPLRSLDELRHAIARARRDDPVGMGADILTYQLFMADGRARLTDLQTTRYADIHLTRFADFACRAIDIGASS